MILTISVRLQEKLATENDIPSCSFLSLQVCKEQELKWKEHSKKGIAFYIDKTISASSLSTAIKK